MKALIVGGGGIADGIAHALDNAGWQFIEVDKEQCDVRNENNVFYWTNKAQADLVVITAGVSHVAKVADSKPSDWQDELWTNLFGSYLVAKYALEVNPEAILVFMGSVAGKYGKPEHSGYSASKAGVISLVQSLGFEGYNAYAISPGRVDTKMREHDYPGEDPATRLKPIEIAKVVLDILDGKYEAGDNIIIRRIGYKTAPIKVDKGEPWRTELKIGQPKTI